MCLSVMSQEGSAVACLPSCTDGSASSSSGSRRTTLTASSSTLPGSRPGKGRQEVLKSGMAAAELPLPLPMSLLQPLPPPLPPPALGQAWLWWTSSRVPVTPWAGATTWRTKPVVPLGVPSGYLSDSWEAVGGLGPDPWLPQTLRSCRP